MPAYDDDDLPSDDDARHSARHHDESWDVDDDRDLPDRRDLVPDEMPTVRCAQCRKLIFEDLPRCPYCGHMQLENDRPTRPLWLIITLIFCIPNSDSDKPTLLNAANFDQLPDYY